MILAPAEKHNEHNDERDREPQSRHGGQPPHPQRVPVQELRPGAGGCGERFAEAVEGPCHRHPPHRGIGKILHRGKQLGGLAFAEQREFHE